MIFWPPPNRERENIDRETCFNATPKRQVKRLSFHNRNEDLRWLRVVYPTAAEYGWRVSFLSPGLYPVLSAKLIRGGVNAG